MLSPMMFEIEVMNFILLEDRFTISFGFSTEAAGKVEVVITVLTDVVVAKINNDQKTLLHLIRFSVTSTTDSILPIVVLVIKVVLIFGAVVVVMIIPVVVI